MANSLFLKDEEDDEGLLSVSIYVNFVASYGSVKKPEHSGAVQNFHMGCSQCAHGSPFF